MSRGFAACIRSDGIAKQSYPNRQAATRAARLVQCRAGRMNVYRCADCRKYHLGH